MTEPAFIRSTRAELVQVDAEMESLAQRQAEMTARRWALEERRKALRYAMIAHRKNEEADKRIAAVRDREATFNARAEAKKAAEADRLARATEARRQRAQAKVDKIEAKYGRLTLGDLAMLPVASRGPTHHERAQPRAGR